MLKEEAFAFSEPQPIRHNSGRNYGASNVCAGTLRSDLSVLLKAAAAARKVCKFWVQSIHLSRQRLPSQAQSPDLRVDSYTSYHSCLGRPAVQGLGLVVESQECGMFGLIYRGSNPTVAFDVPALATALSPRRYCLMSSADAVEHVRLVRGKPPKPDHFRFVCPSKAYSGVLLNRCSVLVSNPLNFRVASTWFTKGEVFLLSRRSRA